MDDIVRAVDLIQMACIDMGTERDASEFAFLREEAEKGDIAFAEACRVVFGTSLSDVFFATLKDAQKSTEHAYRFMTDNLDEEIAYTAILLAMETAFACKLIFRIQQKLKCRWIAQADMLSTSTLYYARAIRSKLDPDGTLCPEAVEPQPRPHIRDRQRDEIIYQARKHEKRSFTSIANELGISPNRVRQVYCRCDREKNGQNADHLQPGHPQRRIRSVVQDTAASDTPTT